MVLQFFCRHFLDSYSFFQRLNNTFLKRLIVNFSMKTIFFGIILQNNYSKVSLMKNGFL